MTDHTRTEKIGGDSFTFMVLQVERETVMTATIFKKLPTGWKDFKNYLKHKRKKMNLEELIVRLWIEEDNRGSKKRGFNLAATKENVVEHGQSSKNKKTKAKPKLGPKGGVFKNNLYFLKLKLLRSYENP